MAWRLSDTLILKKFAKDLKRYRRSGTWSWKKCRDTSERSGPREYLSMKSEYHFPSVNEDEVSEDQVNKRLTDQYDLGYKGDLEVIFR